MNSITARPPRPQGVALSPIASPVSLRTTIPSKLIPALFDAVAVLLSDDGCAALLKEAAAVQWVMDAFGHLKAIGASDAAQPLLDKAGVEPDDGVVGYGQAFIAAATRRFYAREPSLRKLA